MTPAHQHCDEMWNMYLCGTNIGLQLHSEGTAKKMIIILGMNIKSHVFDTIKKHDFIGWSVDIHDTKDMFKLLAASARITVEGEPWHPIIGLREINVQNGFDLFHTFFKDMLTGDDLKWGYDLLKKIELVEYSVFL